jgi:hypothetical protein
VDELVKRCRQLLGWVLLVEGLDQADELDEWDVQTRRIPSEAG